jgi:hypothetical protein
MDDPAASKIKTKEKQRVKKKTKRAEKSRIKIDQFP